MKNATCGVALRPSSLRRKKIRFILLRLARLAYEAFYKAVRAVSRQFKPFKALPAMTSYEFTRTESLKKHQGRHAPFTCVAPLFLFLALCLAISGPVFAGQSESLSALLDKARTQKLYQEPYWRVLVHYRSAIFGVKSLVDDPDFFLAKNGQTDPRAELYATIEAFFEPLTKANEKHAVCRFPARFAWITQKLNADLSVFPVSSCDLFEEIYSQIRPESAVLIFPTAHINSPASMFGHTLLAIETSDKSRLLAQAINYSAVTQETFGPVFAVKGLFGMYKGYFSWLAYYTKLSEYSDVSHRDIWEYQLNLDKTEVHRLLLHLYELENIYSDYFFIDENCSFNLLYLLDAARPGSNLVDQCPYMAVPIDTIRLVQKNGFTDQAPVYRPSKRTKISHLKSKMPKNHVMTAINVAYGRVQPENILNHNDMTREQKARTADFASEIISYLFTVKKLDEQTYISRYRDTLAARSELGQVQIESVDTPPAPETGHLSSRVWAGAGLADNETFFRLGLRPAFHGLCDNPNGFEKGAQILFMDTVFNYYPDDGKLELDRLDFINIVSLALRDPIFKPISWKAGAGFRQIMEKNGDLDLAFYIDPGIGLARNFSNFGLGYVFLEANLAISEKLYHNYTTGIGVRVGFLTNPTPWWSLNIDVNTVRYGMGDCFTAMALSIDQNFVITANTSVGAHVLFSRARSFSSTKSYVAFSLFF